MSPDSGPAGIPDESEDNWPPGEVCPLPFRVAKKISVEYEQAMVNTLDQLCGSRPVLLEVGCSEESLLVSECERVCGKGSAFRVSSWNGGDLDSVVGRDYVRRMVGELKPMVVWFNPDSSAYSPVQRIRRMPHRWPDSRPSGTRPINIMRVWLSCSGHFLNKESHVSWSLLSPVRFGIKLGFRNFRRSWSCMLARVKDVR